MKKLFLILFCFFTTATIYSKNREISGYVLDFSSNNPVEGAVVQAGGRYAVSDSQGYFSFVIPNDCNLLNVSFLGMIETQVDVTNKTLVKIFLKEDINYLEEVVVVGYGEVKKSDLTGSVSSVKKSDMFGQSITSIEQGLQGRLAGVQITQTDASPDGGISVIIRGSNTLTGGTEPLYIIDGFPVSGGNEQVVGPEGDISQAPNMLSFLNPNDIESIEVLKDASATAIYGSRASNGVVLITTKQGKNGQAKIEFTSSVDISTPYRQLDLLSGSEYAEMKNLQYIVKEYIRGDGKVFYEDLVDAVPHSGTYTSEGKYIPSPNDYARGNAEWSDWQDIVLRNSLSQKYNLSASGGTDKFRFYIGGGYDDIQGVLVDSYYKRYSLNSNISAKLTPYILIENSARVAYSNSNRSSMGVNNQGSAAGIMYQVYSQSPLNLVNSIFYDITEEGQLGSDDPYTLATAFKDDNSTINVVENLKLKINILKNLSLTITGGAMITNRERQMYYPTTTRRGELQGGGKAFYGKKTMYRLVNENLVNYSMEKNNHKIMFTVGFTQEYYKNDEANSNVWGFENDITEYYNFTNAKYYDRMQRAFSESSMMSGIFRINYNYSDKYLLTVSARLDASSKFGISHKLGVFPSAAFAWRIDKENFMKHVGWVYNMKFRLSYGVTGNQAISPYQSKLSLDSIKYPNANEDYSMGYTFNNLPNDELRWEKTHQYNLGLDLGFFKNRLALTANCYYKLTSDLLQRVKMAGSLGIGEQYRNAGEIQNLGVELEIAGTPIVKKYFQWNIAANISVNRNKVLSLGDMDSYPGANVIDAAYTPFEIIVGQSLGNIYGYKVEKVIKTQDDLVNAAKDNPFRYLGELDYVKDENGYRKKMLLGNTNPDFIFGFSTDMIWKNLSVSLLFTGSIGNDILNMDNRMLMNLSGGRNTTRDVYNRSWYPDILHSDGSVAIIGNNDGDLPLIWPLDKRGFEGGVIDYFVEDGSFLKLKNLSISYNINMDRRKTRISQIKPYFSASNLFCLSNYSGSDPEASIFGQNPAMRGVDNGSYPLNRTYSLGVNFTF